MGRVMDWNFQRICNLEGYSFDKKRTQDLRNFPIEKVRLQCAIPPLIIGTLGTICYGWTLFHKTSLAAPLILQFIISLTMTAAFQVMSGMLVDLNPASPSTATAANNFVRCLMGAAGVSLIDKMISGMGAGWAFTLIGLVCAVFSPMLWAEIKYGPKWREERRVRMEAKLEKLKVEKEEQEMKV
jgi:hypothetical protein